MDVSGPMIPPAPPDPGQRHIIVHPAGEGLSSFQGEGSGVCLETGGSDLLVLEPLDVDPVVFDLVLNDALRRAEDAGGLALIAFCVLQGIDDE